MSDPYTIYGAIPTGTAILQPGGKLKTTHDGCAVLTQVFKCNFADVLSGGVGLSTGSTHPSFTTLQIWAVGFTQEAAGICTLEVESRGLSPDLGGFPDPTYAIDRTLSNEPLATHPKWVTYIAGKPSAPLNGSIWVDPVTGQLSNDDSTGEFKGWNVNSIFAGIEDYLAPGLTYSKHYAAYDPPSDQTEVGTITTPYGSPPSIPTGYFWLYMGCNYTQQGSVYQISETWRMSGGVQTAAQTILYGS